MPMRPLSTACRPWVGLRSMVCTFQCAEHVENAPIEGWQHKGRQQVGREVKQWHSAMHRLWVVHKH